jgi:hypothetical protein
MEAKMSTYLKFLLYGLIAFSLGFTGAHLLQEGKFSPTSDEGHYYAYAQKISQNGLGAFDGLIDTYFSSVKDQFYPPPTRIGYVMTAAMLEHVHPGYWILGVFSFVCFALFLLVNLHYCQRYFSQEIALFSTVILSASPLLLAMSRRVLIESVFNLLLCLSVWLFLDYLVLRKRLTYVLFLGVLALALMFKESCVVLIPFFILMGWIYPSEKKIGIKEFIGLSLAVLIGGMLVPGLIVGWERWVGALDKLYHLQHTVFLINPYVAKYCAGPWYRYLMDFLLLSPLTLILFLGYIFYYVMKAKNDFNTNYLLIYFVSSYVLMLPLQKNIRYVINLEMVVAIFSAVMIHELVRRYALDSWREWLMVAAVVLIFFVDYSSFNHIFVMGNLLDPVTVRLLSHRGIIP